MEQILVDVIIYQLPPRHPQKFLGTSANSFDSFNRSSYRRAYGCSRKKSYTPESAYTEFNINHPNDYHTHSVSVSDIISIDGKEYFCDSFGWKEIIDGEIINR